MPTNLAIDDNLLNLAKKIGKHKTKRAVVTEALQEYIQRRKQFEITKLFGKVEYDDEYDYKVQKHSSPLQKFHIYIHLSQVQQLLYQILIRK